MGDELGTVSARVCDHDDCISDRVMLAQGRLDLGSLHAIAAHFDLRVRSTKEL
jgi:hypothetical protein